MKKLQLAKILRLGIIATTIMLLFEVLFSIEAISIGITSWVQGQKGIYIYGTIWLMMFIQATIIPIPSITIITASLGVGILNTQLGLKALLLNPNTWLYILIVLSAYMGGAIVTYWVGRLWGKKAIRWCAGSEEDYNKWSDFITKRGKWPYAATVVLPIFPDDLLCLVAGSVKFNFPFFVISNIIGRAIGLIVMVATLVIIGAGGGGWLTLVLWGISLIIQIIAERILTYKVKQEDLHAIM